MLNVNLNYDERDGKAKEKAKKLEKRMRKAVGINFAKILPVLKRATRTAGISTSKSFDVAVKFATKNGTKDGFVAHHIRSSVYMPKWNASSVAGFREYITGAE